VEHFLAISLRDTLHILVLAPHWLLLMLSFSPVLVTRVCSCKPSSRTTNSRQSYVLAFHVTSSLFSSFFLSLDCSSHRAFTLLLKNEDIELELVVAVFRTPLRITAIGVIFPSFADVIFSSFADVIVSSILSPRSCSFRPSPRTRRLRRSWSWSVTF
jgi:hypothetical protein